MAALPAPPGEKSQSEGHCCRQSSLLILCPPPFRLDCGSALTSQTAYLRDRNGILPSDYYEALKDSGKVGYGRFPQIALATPVEVRRACSPVRRVRDRKCRVMSSEIDASGHRRYSRSQEKSFSCLPTGTIRQASTHIEPHSGSRKLPLSRAHPANVRAHRVREKLTRFSDTRAVQVENVTDALSINHNWLNGATIHWSWAQLRADLRECVAQIEDCRPLCTPLEFHVRAQSAAKRAGAFTCYNE